MMLVIYLFTLQVRESPRRFACLPLRAYPVPATSCLLLTYGVRVASRAVGDAPNAYPDGVFQRPFESYQRYRYAIA